MFCLLKGEDFKFVGIFDVHDLITNIIGRLDKVDQWVAGETHAAVALLQLSDAQVAGNPEIDVLLAVEKAEFPFLARHGGGIGIFHDGGQCGIGQHESSVAPALEAVGEQAEGIGVALEMGDVAPEPSAHL